MLKTETKLKKKKICEMFATSQHSIHTILLSVHMGEGVWAADFLSNSITFPDLERFGPHLLSFQFSVLKKKKIFF